MNLMDLDLSYKLSVNPEPKSTDARLGLSSARALSLWQETMAVAEFARIRAVLNSSDFSYAARNQE